MQGAYRENNRKAVGKVLSSSSKPKFPSSQPKSPGPGAAGDGTNVDQLSGSMADLGNDSQNHEWEVYRKPRRGQRQTATTAAATGKTGAQYDTTQRAGYNWQNQPVDSVKQAGRGNVKAHISNSGSNWQSSYMAPSPSIPPPLQNGWQWAKRETQGIPTANSTIASVAVDNVGLHPQEQLDQIGDSQPDTGAYSNASSEEDDAEFDDSDYDLLSDEESDSNDNEMDDENIKQSKWFKKFFKSLESLTAEQINEPSRQWHCPACQGGPGAIDWYKGMQPLVTHAKTKGTQRVKLHRKLADLLEKELAKRGTSVITAGETFAKWKGLKEQSVDHEIVWPPMVIIQNTWLDKDDDDKWIGMGNQELLDYFEGYDAKKARHAYGPRGHRGTSILIFDSSAMGYVEAERLHKHFIDECRDRAAWECRRSNFVPGGKRVLYGYLSTKSDMEYFNQHHSGKTRLKFEMRSYHEMVIVPMKRMEEDNQQLIWYKNRVARGQKETETLRETVNSVGKKLRSKEQENKIVREMSKKQHEESRKEMDAQEEFYRKQIDDLHSMVSAKEKELERLQDQLRSSTLEDYHNQLEHKQANSIMDSGNSKQEDQASSEEKIAKVEGILFAQSKEMEEYELERQKLIKEHDEIRTQFKRKQLEQEVELEKEFKAAMTQLLDKYMARARASSSEDA
ncbi:protein SUPPRESSOR OF GENE SILENCING 3 homolog isoform X1 [Nymphaea colorata]|nr:protein SUPPRESSOR OF GENE SILENCING 3 homolog isoform X1 [Nymphaea colorata]